MVERGGLNYPIRVTDQFTKPLKRFRSELRASKKEFQDFQKSRAKARATSRRSGPKSDIQLERKEAARREKAEQAALAKRARNAKSAQKVRDKVTADRRREEAAVARAEAQRLAAIRKREAAERRAERARKKANKSQLDFLFKFRRLVGTLAIFTLARRGVQGFNELIASAVRFNDTIEASTLGIAGLVNTLADVRNEQGELVKGAEAFAVATSISRKQVAALRQDSLKTVATFEQLLDTFQVAVGPGLAAGLGLDEVRTLAVQISQAATALSVPQNQLAEEIRSLLAGTIQARTTRIATALGITNEDIRDMKEAGTLFEDLTSQLAGFSQAAEKAARGTLGGISTLLKGAFQESLGAASEGLFDNLLDNLNSLFDDVVTIRDEAGNIKPNPEFIAGFERIFEALSNGVDAAVEFGKELGFKGLDTVASSIAGTIDIIVGTLSGLGSVFAKLVAAARAFSEFMGITSKELAAGAKAAAAMGLSFLVIEGALKGFGAITPFVAAVAAIALSINQILEAVTGVQTSIKQTVQLVVLGLAKAFNSVATTVRSVAANISQAFSRAITEIITTSKAAALKAAAFLIEESLLGDPAKAQELRDRAFAIEEAGRKTVEATKAAGEAEIAQIEENGRLRAEALDREIAGILNAADPRTSDPDDGDFVPGAGTPEGSAQARSKGTEAIEKRITLLRQEQTLFDARARTQATIQAAQANIVSDGELALISARAAVTIARAELDLKKQLAKEELDKIAASARSTTGAESEQLRDLFEVTAARRQSELEILATQVRQTEELKRQADLIASGDIGEGINQGLLNFGKEFASEFNAGIEIATTALNGFVDFASQAIVDAFDPTKEVDLVERFARLMQQIAQVIISEIIKIQIAKAIISAAAPTPDAGGAGFFSKIGSFFGIGSEAQGGLIPQHFATGGGVFPRPPSIPASDTVPAWLTPGEFVMRKSAVDALGVSTLSALNSGNFGVTGSADAAGASTGMARGGSVAAPAATSGGGGGTTVVPAVVATERQMDTLLAGGRRAALAFNRENSNTFQRGPE